MSDAVLVTWPRAWRPRMRLARPARPTWSRALPTWFGTPAERRLVWPRLGVSARTVSAGGLLLVAFALLVLAVASLAHVRAAAVKPGVAPFPVPEWIDVPRPVHIFDLEAPSLRGRPLVYTARRRSAGDGREDELAFGTPGRDASALRLRLSRRSGGNDPEPLLFVAIAQMAADSGRSVSRSALSDLLPTRFGAFEITDVTLADAASIGVPCSGFRLQLATPALTMSGLACGAPGKPMSRGTLSCLLDRLDLASGGDDRAMIDFFAASERHRDPACLGARLAPDGLHAAWLDDKPVTHPKTPRRR